MLVFCRKATASWYASSVAAIARDRARRPQALREVRATIGEAIL
jgi:hypothetical protein